MNTKLAGHLPLQDMISSVISDARQKLAAAEGKGEDKGEEKKVKKLVEYEKKEHGGKVPSVKEEEEEKKASAFDFSSSDEIEKLASALDHVSEMLKEADSVELGGESHQGGMVLPTAVPPKGVQPYKHDSSKAHNVPMQTPLKGDPSQGKAATQLENNHAKAPGGPAYPAKGVLKVGSVDAVLSKLAGEKEAFALTDEGHKLDAKRYGAISKALHDMSSAEREYSEAAPGKSLLMLGGMSELHRLAARHSDYAAAKHEKGQNAMNPFGGLLTESRHEAKEKKSSDVSGALDFVLGKMAESSQGGTTLDSKSGEGPKPPSDSKGGNDVRKYLESSEAAVGMKKVDAKKIAKRSLADVLSEPAQSKAHDSKVHENLSNASKGGVKIAQARILLQKIAEEGCTCSGKGECKYCKMKAAMKDKKASKSDGSSAGN